MRLGGTIRPAQRGPTGADDLPHHIFDALEIVRCATTSLALRGTTPSSVFTAYAVFLSRQLARQISSLAPVQLAVGALVILRRRTARRLREYISPSERAGGLSVVSLNKGVSRGKGTGLQGFRTKTLYER